MAISHEDAIKNTMAVNNLRICMCSLKLDPKLVMGINFDQPSGEYVLIIGEDMFHGPDLFSVLQKAADHQ